MKMMKKASGYKPFLFDYTIDACEFMRKRNQPFAKIVWNLFKHLSTVNHTCPYVSSYCRLKAHSRNKTSLNINATFLEPANNIFVKVKLMKKANGYKPFLIDLTIDACEFMRNRNNPVIKIIYKMIKDVSTVNHTCPYVGLQTVSDFYDIRIPVPLPTGEYLLLGDWIFDAKAQFATNVYFTFVED
ncbi:hypothetical protein M5D96_006955 [Drosophila gunungcola]|uniref:Uncharacterized protein n=1 Tax=Drosophila gunungcola TaxID=103775 RepID=A0A9P9YMA8_9MUSC|nr:hypothetical protein M5D96_006955 [Drosophila gunungcola]